MYLRLKKYLLISAFCSQLFSLSALASSGSAPAFDPDNFSNGEIAARIGVPTDGRTPMFAMLEGIIVKLNQQGSLSGIESGIESSLDSEHSLLTALTAKVEALTAEVGASRTSMEEGQDELTQQVATLTRGMAELAAQTKTASLEKITEDCFSNHLIENKSSTAVFVGDATFALYDGDGQYSLQGGGIPYDLFARDIATGTTKQVSLLLLKPEQKALKVLSVLFGLSGQWISNNISPADDLGTIVPTVFDYVLGTRRDGTGNFKGTTVTNAFSKHSSSKGEVNILGKAVMASGNVATNSVSVFLTNLGIKPENDDAKRFRVLCKYLLTTK